MRRRVIAAASWSGRERRDYDTDTFSNLPRAIGCGGIQTNFYSFFFLFLRRRQVELTEIICGRGLEAKRHDRGQQEREHGRSPVKTW